MCHEVAVCGWGLAPSEFWRLSPQEFYAMAEFRMRQARREAETRHRGPNLSPEAFDELRALANA